MQLHRHSLRNDISSRVRVSNCGRWLRLAKQCHLLGNLRFLFVYYYLRLHQREQSFKLPDPLESTRWCMTLLSRMIRGAFSMSNWDEGVVARFSHKLQRRRQNLGLLDQKVKSDSDIHPLISCRSPSQIALQTYVPGSNSRAQSCKFDRSSPERHEGK